jgi:hypothetical protein
VRDEWVKVEKVNPDGDNTTASSTKAVSHMLLTNRSARFAAAKLLWQVSKERGDRGPAQHLAERIDDRQTIQSWAERTGFATMMNEGGKQKLSSHDYAKKLESVYATQPVPIQDRMTHKLHTVNVVSHLFGKDRITDQVPDAEPKFLSALTTSMPNVKYVVAGHDHEERIRVGTMKDRGDVGFFDSGTWTKTGGEDRLNVVVAHTNAAGRMDTPPSLFRVNQGNGAPEFSPRAFEESTQVGNWAAPKH